MIRKVSVIKSWFVDSSDVRRNLKPLIEFKHKLCLYLIALFIFLCSGVAISGVKFVTYNILHEETAAGTACVNPPCTTEIWPNRKNILTNLLVNQDADIISLQEDIQHQVEYIEQRLGDNYSRVGFKEFPSAPYSIHWPRTELHSILYKKDRFSVINSGHFWLSETPDTISPAFTTLIYTSHVAWSKFYDEQERNIFYVFNVHNVPWANCNNEYARFKSTELIVHKIHEINSDGHPMVLMGDFNFANAGESGSTLIDFITKPKYTVPGTYLFSCDDNDDWGELSSGLDYPDNFQPLQASVDISAPRSCSAPEYCTLLRTKTHKYDFIFSSENALVNSYMVLANNADINGFFPSDHAMVSAELSFEHYPKYEQSLSLIKYKSYLIPISNYNFQVVD